MGPKYSTIPRIFRTSQNIAGGENAIKVSLKHPLYTTKFDLKRGANTIFYGLCCNINCCGNYRVAHIKSNITQIINIYYSMLTVGQKYLCRLIRDGGVLKLN